MRKIYLAVATTILMSGCGTMQPSYNPQDDVDVAYIAAVEQAARRNGTNVIWLNTPRKRPAVR